MPKAYAGNILSDNSKNIENRSRSVGTWLTDHNIARLPMDKSVNFNRNWCRWSLIWAAQN